MKKFIEQANRFGKNRTPFFFMLDFEKERPVIHELGACRENGIFYNIEGETNVDLDLLPIPNVEFQANPISFEEYQESFDSVMKAIHYGDSYLTNLCFPTLIESNLTLRDVFRFSKAKYKLLIDQQFMVFSPEPFIKIENGKISTYPMKGTIDARIEDAERKILTNEKEIAEHATIVDLLRNDLNIIANNVRVEKYRYVEEVESWSHRLLQVSSQIVGDLPENCQDHLGEYVDLLTPAGSISGAPKKRTVELIRSAERQNRGYFTGVFGIYDGEILNSGVMIRFIELTKNGLQFWSGGGLTSRSKAIEEYQEMIQKVYVPIY
jgi:para-aminobenzoate synthetase component 1